MDRMEINTTIAEFMGAEKLHVDIFQKNLEVRDPEELYGQRKDGSFFKATYTESFDLLLPATRKVFQIDADMEIVHKLEEYLLGRVSIGIVAKEVAQTIRKLS